jgi:hypothetical protein
MSKWSIEHVNFAVGKCGVEALHYELILFYFFAGTLLRVNLGRNGHQPRPDGRPQWQKHHELRR